MNAKSKSGSTAFHWACFYGHADIAEYIIENSSKMNMELNSKTNGGSTAFHWACYYGHTKVAALLLR